MDARLARHERRRRDKCERGECQHTRSVRSASTIVEIVPAQIEYADPLTIDANREDAEERQDDL